LITLNEILSLKISQSNRLTDHELVSIMEEYNLVQVEQHSLNLIQHQDHRIIELHLIIVRKMFEVNLIEINDFVFKEKDQRTN